jgi:hypothetical protein
MGKDIKDKLINYLLEEHLDDIWDFLKGRIKKRMDKRKARKAEKEDELVDDDEDVEEIDEDQDTFLDVEPYVDWDTRRRTRRRFNYEGLKFIDYNLKMKSSDLRDLKVELPQGFVKGDDGVFFLMFDAQYNFLFEKHSSHDTSKMIPHVCNEFNLDVDDIEYVMAIWTKFEGEGGTVFGRSALENAYIIRGHKVRK